MVSAIAHAASLTWLTAPRQLGAPVAPPPDGATAARPPPEPPRDEAVDVALLDEPTPVAAPVPAPAPAVAHALAPSGPAPARAGSLPPGAAATVTAGAPRPTEGPGAAAGHRPDRPSLLAMRRGEAPSAALPSGRWDNLDHAPRGTAPQRDPSSGLLHDAGGGSHRSEQGGFDAIVHSDGTVALRDNPSFHVRLAVPSLRDLGRGAASWYTSDKGPSGTGGDPAMAGQVQVSSGATVAASDPTGTAPKEHNPTVVVPVLGGSFEVTDWLMRRHGQDPYAARKLAVLDATRDERVAIGKRHRAAELARTPEIVHRQLELLWAGATDLAERKQGLFELWDDCVEAGDPEVVAAAATARRMIIGFLRAHLPAGSSDAYTPAELAALARTRQSQAAFAPYE
ncbi:MAG TPA: hypothetical protein VHT91_12300 [Kofleriaceae bacterium]|nr:hypothetical protein [Kofleriaceae bacterium]